MCFCKPYYDDQNNIRFTEWYCSRYDLERQREIRREKDGNKTDGPDLLERLEAIISTVQWRQIVWCHKSHPGVLLDRRRTTDHCVKLHGRSEIHWTRGIDKLFVSVGGKSKGKGYSSLCKKMMLTSHKNWPISAVLAFAEWHLVCLVNILSSDKTSPL